MIFLIILGALAVLVSIWPELFTNHIPHELGLGDDEQEDEQ